MDRPTTSAFWNMSVARQLVLALNAIEFDDTLRATVLTVAAPSSHLKKVLENQHPDGHKSAAHEEWDRLYEAMCLLKKPRVAAINSIAALSKRPSCGQKFHKSSYAAKSISTADDIGHGSKLWKCVLFGVDL
jgi:hypothetical protein